MRHLVLLLGFAALSCAAPDAPCSSGEGAPPDTLPDAIADDRRGPLAGSGADAARELPVLFAGATDTGAALANATTGRVVGRSPGALVEDLLVDSARRRIVTYEIDDVSGDEGGTLVARDLDAPTGLGPPRRLAFIDGRVRLGEGLAGVVVFEDSFGSRWRELADGGPSVGIPAPMPSSVWSAGGGRSVTALTHEGDGTWALRSFDVLASGLSPVELAPLPALRDASARAVSLDDGRVVALDLDEHALVVRPEGGTAARLAHAHRAVADACALPGGVVAILAAGPARLVVVTLDELGKVTGEASLALDEPVREDASLLSRSLLPVGARRLLVGTTRRVVAVDIVSSGASAAGGTTMRLSRDAAFDGDGVHAPIDGPIP